jgi:hypothetical protein
MKFSIQNFLGSALTAGTVVFWAFTFVHGCP